MYFLQIESKLWHKNLKRHSFWDGGSRSYFGWDLGHVDNTARQAEKRYTTGACNCKAVPSKRSGGRCSRADTGACQQEELDKLGPCLISRKFCKIFQIFRYIEYLDVCMEY